MNKKIAILYSMLLVVVSSSILTTFNLTESENNTPDLDEAIPIEVDFIPKVSKSWDYFSFIYIKDNWSDTATKEWCSGDGSYNNPYIIENMTINATNSPTGIGILIEDSKTDYL